VVDYWIFGFGLVVTVIVGFGLATMIITHNRLIERGSADVASSEVAPVESTSSAGTSN
jgi:hypothetical protein